MTQEALKLALNFVETVHVGEWVGSIERQLEVITAIKEALAQEKALQALHSENERLGLYKDAYARTWVGLTDDEYFALQMKIKAPMISVQDYIDAMRMVETKLKERNT